MKKLYPTQILTHFRELNLDHLQANGIRMILSDLDNTLVPNGVIECSRELQEWIHELTRRQIVLIIVSNNTENRVKKFAEPLGLEYYYDANKPQTAIFEHIFAKHNYPPTQAIMIGDRLLTDIYGGNKMGMHTVLVEPIDPRVSKRLKIKQLAEQGLLKCLHCLNL